MIRIIEPRLGEVNVQNGIVGMPGEVGRCKIPVVVVRELAGAGNGPPNIVLQLGEGLPVVLGVIPGIAHNVFMDIQQAVPVAPLGKLLHPLAPGGVDVLLLVVIGAEHHQVVALEAVVVDDELPVVHLPGVGGLGVPHSHKQAVVLVGGLVPLSERHPIGFPGSSRRQVSLWGFNLLILSPRRKLYNYLHITSQ